MSENQAEPRPRAVEKSAPNWSDKAKLFLKTIVDLARGRKTTLETPIAPPEPEITVAPTISRAQRRAEARARYLAEKTSTVVSPVILHESNPVAEPQDTALQAKREGEPTKKLHPSLEKVNGTNENLTLGPEKLPWAERNIKVKLAEITLKDSGISFYFGSCLKTSKRLVEAANQLTDDQRSYADVLLYNQVPAIITNGYSKDCKVVEGTTTVEPIFYVGNKQGQRVYFMRFGKLNDKDVIIRVAVCDKAKQSLVLTTITTNSRKTIRKKSKL